MKSLVLFLALFGVLLVHAQEMDTTYVINEQGQTIGIIHAKGTVPVMMPQQQAPAQPMMQAQPLQAQPMMAQPQPQPWPPRPANPAFGMDSTAYYQSLISQYTESGNNLRSTGKAMMLAGGIATPVCFVLMLVGFGDNDDALGLIGYMGTLAGIAVFSTGITIKIIGGAKLRKANRYNDRLIRHQMRRQYYSMNLHVNPVIDPINNNVGGALALEF